MVPYGFIYITTNLINGKRYVGQCALHRRNWKTYLGSGKALKKAVAKYGRSNFCREIICYCFSKADMNVVEKDIITEYDAINRTDFYNISPDAYTTRGFTGKTHTQETKLILSEYGKSRPATPRMKESCALVGRLPRTDRQKEAARQNATNMGHKNHKPKEVRQYVCCVCSKEFNKLEYSHHSLQRFPCCSQKCSGYRSRLTRKSVRKICVCGVTYDCIKDAAQALAVSYDVMYYRIKHPGFTDYQYEDA